MKVIANVTPGIYAIVEKGSDETNDAALGRSKQYRGKAAAERALAKMKGESVGKKSRLNVPGMMRTLVINGL